MFPVLDQITIILLVLSSVSGDFTNVDTVLQKIHLERQFHTLAIFQNNVPDCVGDNFIKKYEIPRLLMQNPNSTYVLTEGNNSEMLIYFCLSGQFKEQQYQLKNLLEFLGRKRDTRIVFYWKQQKIINGQSQLEQLFNYCKKHSLFDVICLLNNFGETLKFHTYTQFPSFTVLQQPLNTIEGYFPERVRNLQGGVIRTIARVDEPRVIVYKDNEGKDQVLGYIARIVRTFVKKHNATLQFITPDKPGISLDNLKFEQFIISNEIDIPIGVTILKNFNQSVSSIVDLTDLKLMLPIMPRLKVHMIFLRLLSSTVTLIIILLVVSFSLLLTLEKIFWWQRRPTLRAFFQNYIGLLLTTTLRGILGQSIYECGSEMCRRYLRRFICLCLFVTAIFTVTSYNALQQSYITNPPRMDAIKSFDELLTSPTKVLVWKGMLNVLYGYLELSFMEKYNTIFTFDQYYAVKQYQFMLDTRYIYVVEDAEWQIIQFLQTRLSTPRFYIPLELPFKYQMHITFPMIDHCIYRRSLTRLIQQLHESGILNQWHKLSFFEMIEAGRLNPRIEYRENGSMDAANSLTVSDLRWVWVIYIFGMILATAVFAAEQMLWRKQRKLNLNV